MQEVEVTFGRAAAIWWAWIWRAMLITILTSVALGLVLGFIERTLLPPEWHFGDPDSLRWIGRLTGALLGSLISIRVLQKILQRRFKDFRIVLVHHQDYYTEPF